jgi:hypothetical protein
MKPSEYRLLQLILSHVSGDRVTLALLHWDGARLRVASSFAPLALRRTAQADVVQRTVRAKLARAVKQAEQAPAGLGLKDVVPVCEGLGASLYGSPIRAALTHDPEARFQDLCDNLRLEAGPVPVEVR